MGRNPSVAILSRASNEKLRDELRSIVDIGGMDVLEVFGARVVVNMNYVGERIEVTSE